MACQAQSFATSSVLAVTALYGVDDNIHLFPTLNHLWPAYKSVMGTRGTQLDYPVDSQLTAHGVKRICPSLCIGP